MKVLNATQHTLTTEQTVAFGNEAQIINLRDADSALFAELANTPADRNLVIGLAYRFIGFLLDSGFDIVHLPIGSPAFQFELGVRAALVPVERRDELPKFLFSHTRRESVETVDASGSISKTSIFKFEKFI